MATLAASIVGVAFTVLNAGFVPVGAHDGVQVFQHKKAALIELAAIGEIEAPPAEVQAVLLDYANARRLTERVAESQVLARKPGELFVYQHLKLPVIADRDFTLRVAWNNAATRTVQFTVDNARGPTARHGVVRMSTLEGQWDLEPIREGTATRATYHIRLDFAGSVPRWMVGGGAAKDLPKLYQNVRRLVANHSTSAVASASHK
jgi:hypothetical protein